MSLYTVKCPERRTTLQSDKPIPAGKPLTCPKRDVMFSAPAPVRVVGGVEVVEDVEGVEDVEVVCDNAPPRKPPRKPAAAAPSSRVDAGVEVVEDDEDEDDAPRPKGKKKGMGPRPKRKSGG